MVCTSYNPLFSIIRKKTRNITKNKLICMDYIVFKLYPPAANEIQNYNGLWSLFKIMIEGTK